MHIGHMAHFPDQKYDFDQYESASTFTTSVSYATLEFKKQGLGGN